MTCKTHWKPSILSQKAGKDTLHLKLQVKSVTMIPCAYCRIEAMLKNNIEIFNQYGAITDSNGVTSLVFKSDTSIEQMHLYMAVSSINNFHNVMPNDSCAYYNEHNNVITTRKILIENICQKKYQKLIKINTNFQKTPRRDLLCNSSSFIENNGMWSTTQKSYTDVGDIYTWKFDNCVIKHESTSSFKKRILANTKIVFIGDSVMGNFYVDFVLFLLDKTKDVADRMNLRNRGFKFGQGREIKYFRTYGFYTFNGRCCNEPDCKTRQIARKPYMGFEQMRHMKQWLIGASKCTIFIHSPIIHQARAYVTNEEHIRAVKQILQQIKSIKCRLFWLSTTPMSYHDQYDKNKFVDNRSDRRYRLHLLEKEILQSQKQIYWIDLWDMFWTRKDRYKDVTHVYPVNPRILSSTVSAMFKVLLT